MKLIPLVPLLLAFVGCANPDWVTPASTIPSKEAQKAGGCALHFAKAGLCGTLVWNKAANDSVTGELGLSFVREDSLLVVDPAATPFVYLWMPSMGHGSSPIKTTRTDVGTFNSSGVFFVMPGNWDIHVQLKSGNQVVDEVTVPFFYKGGG